MEALIGVILPVFLVVAAGWATAWRGWLGEPAVDGLMRFAQNIAIPVLLFLGIARLDLAAVFDLRLLGAFYAGALSGFVLGLLGARYLFGRGWEDAVAVGFVCLFSNSLLLGLPITERAYGPEALGPNLAIIAIHAPICYTIGITAMEVARASGAGILAGLRQVARGLATNALVIGIALGLAVNLSGLGLPVALWDALELIARAGLPAALFGLGGVLFRYRPEGDLRLIAYACAVSLVVHPAIVWMLATWWGLGTGPFRSAVITAAMAPGVNAYLFANMYGRAKRVAASTVLIGTVACAGTAWIWMTLLP
jgi:malonate transporter and related proteins